VSKVFVPKPRSEKAKFIEVPGGNVKALAQAAVAKLFDADPTLAADLEKAAGAC
jgi:electron transfer flavoprotein beta subunit